MSESTLVVIRIVGSALGNPTLEDGQYVREYCACGNNGHGYLRVTDDMQQARVFPSLVEAFACYRESCGLRPDGKPNRPLTAYTVEMVPVTTLAGDADQ